MSVLKLIEPFKKYLIYFYLRDGFVTLFFKEIEWLLNVKYRVNSNYIRNPLIAMNNAHIKIC